MKIDVHWHYMPEEYVAQIRRDDGPYAERAVTDADGAEWLTAGTFRHPLVPELYQPDAQLREMDRRGIDLVAVSPSPTLFYYQAEGAQALQLHRLVNDRIADLVAAYPGRYTGLAAVPLQSTDLAVAELERAMLVKGLRGVEIGTNIAGRNLDAPDFRPFFRRAQELGAFVFVHPSTVLGADRLRNYYLTNLIGNPVDTSVAIASLIFGGVFDEFPQLTCCFAHGGGVFPAIAGRWQHGHHLRPEPSAITTRPPMEYLDRIYVDSLTHSDHTRRLALDLLGDDHMLLGSDLPFDMGDPDPAATIERMPGLNDSQRRRIMGETAARLLGIGTPVT